MSAANETKIMMKIKVSDLESAMKIFSDYDEYQPRYEHLQEFVEQVMAKQGVKVEWMD